jgi:hypothetical protein
VVDEQPAADARRRVDLHARHDLDEVREHAGNQRDARLVQDMGDAVREQGLDASVGEQDLDPADAARRRVALLRRGQVLPHLLRDARECGEPDHGAKNGVLT